MKKIGILTFHYSNNYGGVLQTLSLYKTVESLGYDVEVINYIPSNYRPYNFIGNLDLKNKIFKKRRKDMKILDIVKKANIMHKYCNSIIDKFNVFRNNNMSVTHQVDEYSLESILDEYSTIIVGSDQVWNPSQRKNPIYFLDFGDKYKGEKISYAADSTVKEVINEDLVILKKALSQFHHISVRNDHSFEFVKTVINKDTKIVSDPTLLYDFHSTKRTEDKKERYILTYILGKEIAGSHDKVIEKIKNKYGNIPVYSIKIPTMNFELSPYADKVFYDLNPDEWIRMFRNAKFIYTDSFHGVLFSLKYHKPFIAYYTEKLRATRFIDLGKRFGIEKYIIQNTTEIDDNQILDILPNFDTADKVIDFQKKVSLEFLKKSLSD